MCLCINILKIDTLIIVSSFRCKLPWSFCLQEILLIFTLFVLPSSKLSSYLIEKNDFSLYYFLMTINIHINIFSEVLEKIISY